jgi:hypothetical protein
MAENYQNLHEMSNLTLNTVGVTSTSEASGFVRHHHKHLRCTYIQLLVIGGLKVTDILKYVAHIAETVFLY